MKLTLIGILSLIASTGWASDTNRLTRGDSDVLTRLSGAGLSTYPLVIGQQDDKTTILVMEGLESDTLRDLFPNHKVYRLISTRSLVHSASFSAMLLGTNGTPTYLRSDKEVANFVGNLTLWGYVSSKSNALELVRAFAALRSYRIVESTPDFEDIREPQKQPAALASDFKFFAEDRKGQLRVYATLFTDEYSGSYKRYVFTIYKKPGAGFSFSKPVLVRLRNYVF